VLRVLQVTTDTDRRGGQMFAMDLGAGLDALGHDVRTVALTRGTVGGLPLDALGPSRWHPRTLAMLRAAIRDADVVVGHGSTTLPTCAIAAAGTGVPFVYRQISDSHFWANTAARRLRVRAGLRRAHRVVALWRGAAEVLVRDFGVSADRVVRIPNAVPVDRFAVPSASERIAARAAVGLDADDLVVAFVGALVPEKGVDLAIDALGHRDDVTLLIAGDGDARPALTHQARRRSCRVRFLGSVEKPTDVYSAADVVVLPSRGGDSMPATLIEAGMMGIPVVTTDVGAIADIVSDGVSGLVVAPDDLEGLRSALDRVCGDVSVRVRFGHQAREWCVERFSIDAVASSWSNLLRSAVRPGTLGRPTPVVHTLRGGDVAANDGPVR